MKLLRRIRDAIAVLLGLEDRTPASREELHDLSWEVQQLRQEWVDTLEKLNVWYARQAKREKRALERAGDAPTHQPAPPPANGLGRKRDLYRRAGVTQSDMFPSAPTAPPPPSNGDDEP